MYLYLHPLRFALMQKMNEYDGFCLEFVCNKLDDLTWTVLTLCSNCPVVSSLNLVQRNGEQFQTNSAILYFTTARIIFHLTTSRRACYFFVTFKAFLFISADRTSRRKFWNIRIKTLSMSREYEPLDITARHPRNAFPFVVLVSVSFARYGCGTVPPRENGNGAKSRIRGIRAGYERIQRHYDWRLNNIAAGTHTHVWLGFASQALDNLHTKKIEEPGRFRPNCDFDFALCASLAFSNDRPS